jgi:hypothetical protein
VLIPNGLSTTTNHQDSRGILWNKEDSGTDSQESEGTVIEKGHMVFAYHAEPDIKGNHHVIIY